MTRDQWRNEFTNQRGLTALETRVLAIVGGIGPVCVEQIFRASGGGRTDMRIRAALVELEKMGLIVSTAIGWAVSTTPILLSGGRE